MDTTHANPELFAALAAAQSEVENADKTAKNAHFNNKYADLAEVLNTVRPVFSKNGLSITQATGFNGELVTVTTLLAHKGGGYITSEAACKPAKTDAQGIGAATTYLRRYSLAAMTGVAQEDDDGNAAAHNGKPQAVPKAEKVISEQEEIDLRTALGDDTSRIEGCCAYFGVERLSDLPASKLAEAKTLATRKRAA
jgi:hypothetical protein